MHNYIESKDKRKTSYIPEEVLELLQGQITAVLSLAAARARWTGLGLSEMIALEHLQRAYREGEGLTPTQLGRKLYMSSGTITALVDRLERAGYVERRPNPADRRSLVVVLRPEGLQEVAPQMRSLAAELLEVGGRMPDEERVVVGRYLHAVTEVIGRRVGGV
jgi:DNA-binding MarR family transcriptional regulator